MSRRIYGCHSETTYLLKLSDFSYVSVSELLKEFHVGNLAREITVGHFRTSGQKNLKTKNFLFL